MVPLAVRLCLEAVNRGLEMTQEEGLFLEATLFGLTCATEDMKEGTGRIPRETCAELQREVMAVQVRHRCERI